MHTIDYAEFSIDTKTTDIASTLERNAKRCGDGLAKKVEFIDKTFDTYDEAIKWLNANDSTYRNFGVKYRDVPPSMIMEDKTRIKLAKDMHDKYDELYERKNKLYSKSVTATYITCKTCGSKLKRELMRSNDCPLCRGSFRTDVMNKSIEVAEKRYKSALDALEAYDKKFAQKNKANLPVHWVVKYEYHS